LLVVAFAVAVAFAFKRLRKGPLEGPATVKPPALPEDTYSVRLLLPAFADEFVAGKATKSLQPFGEVVGGNEVAEVRPQLVMVVVMVALNGCFQDGAVHAFHLTVGPGMVGLC
jgi:hypothetical protein